MTESAASEKYLDSSSESDNLQQAPTLVSSVNPQHGPKLASPENNTRLPLSPQSSHKSVIVQQLTLFSREVRHLHKKVWISTATNLLLMSTLILLILSVYWGSIYNRTNRAHNLNIWVLDFDEAPNSTTEAFVGPSLTKFTNSLPFNPQNLKYEVRDPSEYHGNISTVAHDTVEEVAWGIIAIAPNASSTLLNSLNNPSQQFSPDNLVSFYFAEARQDSVFDGLVIPLVQMFADKWAAEFRQSWWSIVNNTLTTLESRDRVYQTNPNIITNPVEITLQNVCPVFGPVYPAILITGLIYLIIVSFFQIPFFAGIHLTFLGKVNIVQYMLYRPFVNFVSVLFLSLAFSLVSLAFQTDFTIKFGKAGFIVYWMINYISMMALGGASENAAIILFTVFPPSMGFWLIFWVCINAATSFSPLELSAGVYHIGRALPVHNSQMAIRTVLFGTKNQLGKNFGILFAWIFVNYVVSWPCMAFAKWYKTKQAKKAAMEAANNNSNKS